MTSVVTDTPTFVDSATPYKNLASNEIPIETLQRTATVSQNNSILIINSSNAKLNTVTVQSGVTTTTLNYTNLISSNQVYIQNSLTVTASTVKMTMPDNFTITSAGWNGLFKLESTTIDTNSLNSGTTIFTSSKAVKIGSDTKELTFDVPVRIVFTGEGGNGNNGFGYLKRATSNTIELIDTQCNADNLTTVKAQLSAGQACVYDDGTDFIIWTTHATAFGHGHKSSTSSSTSSASSTSSGGSGRTGVGPSGTGRSIGGILSTPLTINEITYDRCEANMATVLVSSDADTAPSVTVHTAKSGSVLAKLADNQPYEQSNKITKIDKYLYEIPISSDETFLMIVVTEQKGVSKNIIQSSIHLTSCEGTTTISKVPEATEPEIISPISSSAPQIFDVKFQIGNNTQHRSDVDSEFSYVDNQDLSVSAIVSAEAPLNRSELRIVTMGQTSDQYSTVKMNAVPLLISNSTYVISATVPSYLIKDPAVSYWIYVSDDNQNQAESKQYDIGVKPASESNVSFEMDMPSAKAGNTLVRSQLFVNNKDSPSYGTASLIVDGNVVYKKSQLFTTGKSIVDLEWKSPHVDKHMTYDVMAKVDLYDKSLSTQSAKLHIYPKTVVMSLSDVPSLELITDNDTVLAEPALIYASHSNPNLRFHVTSPDGQCILGASDECAVQNQGSTQDSLKSVSYEDQILRVRYSGTDTPLKRFSITSIDPIVGKWNISLESSNGIIPQVHATDDVYLKVKYRIHSQIITVYEK